MAYTQRLSAASLTTPRLQLRRPEDADLPVLRALHADPAAHRFCACWAPSTPQAVQAQLTQWLDHWQQHGFGHWAITEREDSARLVGFGGVAHRTVGDQAGLYLFYRLLPKFWGRGYASEMAQEALRLAFTHWGAAEVFAAVLPTNAPTRKTLQGLGLRVRGALADRPGDAACLLYEVTRDAWASQPRHSPQAIPFAA